MRCSSRWGLAASGGRAPSPCQRCAQIRPELDRAVAWRRDPRLWCRGHPVVHEHKRLGRGIELAASAELLKAADIGLEFLTGEL